MPPPPTTPSVELRYSLPIDVPVTIVAGGAVVGMELDRDNLVPSSCNWCDRRKDGTDSLDGFDAFFRDAFARRDTTAADTASNILAYGVAPLSAVGFLGLAAWRDDGSLHHTPIDVLLTAEATFLAMDVNQVVKFAVARERPYVHFGPADARATDGSGSRVSFYSLHTSATFALAVSAGTVAEMRGYTIAPLVWGSGLLLGVATGYLRMAADQHYMSDVLIGAAMGSAIGFLVPYTFHRPIASNVHISASPAPGGMTLGAWGGF